MTIYKRYILKNLAIYFFITTLTLTSIVWVTQSLRGLDLIINRGVGFIDFLNISILLIPYLMLIIIPISLFISLTMYIHKFVYDKEMIILKTSGKSNISIAKPIVTFALMIMIMTYIISMLLLPFSYGKYKDLQSYFKNQYIALLLQEGIFSSQIKNLTLFINSKNNNIYNGIIIFDHREVGRLKTLTAQSGEIKKMNNEIWFELSHGTHQEKKLDSPSTTIFYFDKYAVNLTLLSEEYLRTIEPTEKYIFELFSSSSSGADDNRSITHAHFRIVWPMYCLTLSLMSCAILIKSKYKRVQKSYNNLLITGLGLLFILFSILFNNLTLSNPYFAILMYIMPLIPILLNTLLLIKDEKVNMG